MFLILKAYISFMEKENCETCKKSNTIKVIKKELKINYVFIWNKFEMKLYKRRLARENDATPDDIEFEYLEK